jgi:hypothetical protein
LEKTAIKNDTGEKLYGRIENVKVGRNLKKTTSMMIDRLSLGKTVGENISQAFFASDKACACYVNMA